MCGARLLGTGVLSFAAKNSLTSEELAQTEPHVSMIRCSKGRAKSGDFSTHSFWQILPRRPPITDGLRTESQLGLESRAASVRCQASTLRKTLLVPRRERLLSSFPEGIARKPGFSWFDGPKCWGVGAAEGRARTSFECELYQAPLNQFNVIQGVPMICRHWYS